MDDSEKWAALFHETYETLAPEFGYETREESAVPWETVPEPNKSLMIATASVVAKAIIEDHKFHEKERMMGRE